MDVDRVAKLKNLLSEEIYEELRAFFQEQINDLYTLDSVRELAHADDQAVELKACKMAHEKVVAIFQHIMNVKDYVEPEKSEGNDFGLPEPPPEPTP